MDVVACLLWIWVCAYCVSCKQVNVALKKNASTTSGVYNGDDGGLSWYPSGAVDGDHDELNSPSSCFHSATSPADWTVDLGQRYQLYYITVYIRRRLENRTANSSIYVDNDPSRVCYTFPSIISDNPTHLTCNETARYVTIRNPGDEGVAYDSLNICEVEIYACTAGYRGVDCEVDCHCDMCNRWTGICDSTCDLGLEGERCNRGCPISTYGVNCSKKCKSRHCIDKSTCDHVTGSCDLGCEAGWKSFDCTEECVVEEEFGKNCSGFCIARHCLNKSSCDPVHGTCDTGCETGWEGRSRLRSTRVADVTAVPESTTSDAGTIALSSTVGVLVVIIVTLAVLLIREKLKKRSSEDANKTSPDPIPITNNMFTDITSSNTDGSTTPSTYETLRPTEDSHYTGLK